LITHPGSRWWFYDELRPMVNYVPIHYDLSDLVEKIEWLLSHDEEAQQIALNALELSNRVFSPTFQQDYINNGIQQILQQDH
jgi:spore maturation protein CgeB